MISYLCGKAVDFYLGAVPFVDSALSIPLHTLFCNFFFVLQGGRRSGTSTS